MKTQKADLVFQAQANALALFNEAAGDSKNQHAAECLLAIALHATSLVHDLHRGLNPDAINEASKAYESFPVLASGVRQTNNRQLKLLYAMPLGQNKPFKSAGNEVGPATKGSFFRELIVSRAYPAFMRIRSGADYPSISPKVANEIRLLPAISRKSAAAWAKLMAQYFTDGTGGDEFINLNTFGSPSKTKMRNGAKRKDRLCATYGGRKLAEKVDRNGKTRFYAAGVMKPVELDAVAATKLQTKAQQLAKAELRPPERSEQVSDIADAFYDCLKSMLRK